MKLNLVTDHDLLLNKGDAMVYIGHGGKLQLMIVCPGCGEVSGSAGTHVFDKLTKSYTPSIIHSKELGGCGWHGWITNGEFTNC